MTACSSQASGARGVAGGGRARGAEQQAAGTRGGAERRARVQPLQRLSAPHQLVLDADDSARPHPLLLDVREVEFGCERS